MWANLCLLGHILPISRVLGLDLSLFWASLRPKSVHFGGSGTGFGLFRGILGLDSGHFGGSCAYFKPKLAHLWHVALDLGRFYGT